MPLVAFRVSSQAYQQVFSIKHLGHMAKVFRVLIWFTTFIIPDSFIYFIIYIEIFQCCLYLLWTIGAHSVQGSSQCPFFRSCCLDSNPDSGNANMVYQRLNDVGHPDPLIYERSQTAS